ncbi:MAG: hypothetical protein QNJ54_06225 [Prochloraceae cyanobacterium]|nr:hypothetical protein [Prochloraceae cyanobacterium]
MSSIAIVNLLIKQKFLSKCDRAMPRRRLDRIREQLQQMGITLIDRPNGETSIICLDNTLINNLRR